MVSSPVVSCPVVNDAARLVGARPSCYKMEALSHRTPDHRETEANPCRFQGGAAAAADPSCKPEGASLPGLGTWSTPK